VQLTIGGEDEDWRAAEYAVDAASARFGPGAVRPAALVDPVARADPRPAGEKP
jgi:DNA polymerase-4